MRLKVPFLGYALAGIAFLLPTVVLAAMLPFLINAQPIRAKLIRELGSWTGGEVRLAGSISVQDFFSLSVEAQNVEIGRFNSIAPIEGLKAQRIVARIAWFNLLSGNFNFDKVKISDAVVKVRASGPSEVAGVLTGLISGQQSTPFAAMVVENTRVALHRGEGKPYRRLEVKSAVIRSAKSGRRLVASAQIVWKDRPLTMSMRSAFGATAATRMPFQFSAESDILSASFDGQAALAGPTDAEGVLSLRSPDLAVAADWLEVDISPAALRRPVSAAGDFSVGPDQLTLTSAAISISGQSAQAALTLKRGKAAPRLEGVLAFERLDATSLLAQWRDGVVAPVTGPLRIPIESDLRISSKTVSWGGIEAGPIALAVSSGPERLTADVAELGFLGGEVRGHIALDLTGALPRASARLSGETLDAGGLLALAKQRDWLRGAADVNVEAEAAIDDPSEFMERLVAHARVNFPEGGQMRLDIPRIATSAVGEISGWNALDLTSAEFDRLRFDISLQAGQISFANVVLAAGGRQLSGRGEIDLAGRSLDWRFNVLPTAEPAAMPRARSRDASAAESRLSIKGPWGSPTIRKDGPPTTMLQGGGQAAGLEVSLSGR
jgi:AsmA protein